MRWNFIPKSSRLLQITAEYQDCLCFTVFLTIKTSSQNISLTLSQISLKLHEHRGGYWRKELPLTILEEQFPVPKNTAASKIGNGVILLLWQLRFIVTLIITNFHLCLIQLRWIFFPNLWFWRRSVYSNLGGIDPEKLYRAAIIHNSRKYTDESNKLIFVNIG